MLLDVCLFKSKSPFLSLVNESCALELPHLQVGPQVQLLPQEQVAFPHPGAFFSPLIFSHASPKDSLFGPVAVAIWLLEWQSLK